MANTCPDTSTLYTGAQMAGLALGLTLPLLIALLITLHLLRREKSRNPNKKPKLMYKLPDDHDDSAFTFQRPGAAPDLTYPSSARKASFKKPGHVREFMERCGRKDGGYEDLELQRQLGQVVELEGAPPYREVQRFELGDCRFSR